jgi:membrane protein implicated in regulation of membrane protease activity
MEAGLPFSIMITPNWNRKTLFRYSLIQIPGVLFAGAILWVLHNHLGLSQSMAWAILLLWLAKDVLLFFFVWPAYQGSEGDGYYSLVGLHGEVANTLNPEGYVRIRGILWKARTEQKNKMLPTGTKVVVVGRDGIELIVRSHSS